MLSCKEFTELVTDHLEGQLPLAQRVSVSLHLGSCQSCRAYLGQMKSLLKLLRQLPVDPSPPRVSEALLLSFRGMTRT
jgi:predicted anti-sigma-YlaC factor YlaD